MPSLSDAVVKRISALTRTATDADLTDSEYMAVDDASAYTRKITVASLATWILGRIKSLATIITSFRSGDVIPVDGPSGTAKMSKDDLLAVTAQNALNLLQDLLPKVIDLGEASVSEVNATRERQDGWCYKLTDSGFVNYGTTLVNAGDFVVWDATDSMWLVVKPDIGIGSNDDIDFAVTDEEGNAAMTVEDGYLKTKNFDSETAVKAISVISDTLVFEI